MGSTNFTPNYNLPQFIGTDKPAWLTDVNGAFSSIDTAIKNAADAASNASSVAGTASSTATAAANTANTLDTQINTPSTGLAAVVSNHTTDISGIASDIGNTPLTTVAQTLTGAIEEVKASIPSTTGLLALISVATLSMTYDGSTTIGSAMNSIYTDLVSLISGLGANEYIKVIKLDVGAGSSAIINSFDQTLMNTVPTSIMFGNNSIGANNVAQWSATLSSASKISGASITNATPPVLTITAAEGNTPTAGNVIQLHYEKYKVY